MHQIYALLDRHSHINKTTTKENKLHMYKKLKDRIRQLNNENMELKKQIEILYGKLYQNES